MKKTVHSKLTEQIAYHTHNTIAYPRYENVRAGVMHEMNLLRQAANDLLQPRPEAVANLLKMAKDI